MHSGNLPSKHQNNDDKTHVANVRAFALTSAFFSTKCFTHANAWAFCISKISDLKIKKHPFWISDKKSNQQHLKCKTLLYFIDNTWASSESIILETLGCQIGGSRISCRSFVYWKSSPPKRWGQIPGKTNLWTWQKRCCKTHHGFLQQLWAFLIPVYIYISLFEFNMEVELINSNFL